MSEILKTELETTKSAEVSKPILKNNERPSFKENLLSAFNDMFDGLSIQENENSNEILVQMDNKIVKINTKSLTIKCEEDKQLEQIVSNVVNQIKNLS